MGPHVRLAEARRAADAILLGALVIHGLQPGPLLFANNPFEVNIIIATVLVANVFMLAFMLVSVGWLSRLMYVPRALLLPVILACCVIGTYALSNRAFDVGVMLAFGALGFAMERLKIPLAPFVIGFVLAPIAEKNLCAGLMLSGGSYAPLEPTNPPQTPVRSGQVPSHRPVVGSLTNRSPVSPAHGQLVFTTVL